MRGNSFVGSARTIGALTLLSRVLGMVRDVLCSHLFGAGMVWDAFTIAYRVPNLFRRLFGEGALTAAFVPAFVSRWEGGREQDARALLNRLVTALGTLLLAITAVGVAVTFAIPHVWTDAKTALFSELLRLMVPYLFLICTAAILAATLQSLRHFAMPAFAPVLLNLIWIGALFLSRGVKIHLVALAITAGGMAQLLILLPPLWRRGIAFRPDLTLKDEGVKEVGRSFMPVVFGLALVQVNELLDSVIAELCVPGHGAVSALYYGNQLVQLPLSIIGISVATAVFPAMSSPREDLPALLEKALRVVLRLAIPATVGLIVFAPEIIALIFEHGSFTAEDTRRAAWVLRLYGAGLWCYCANQVQVRAFYAMKDMKTPVKVSASMVFLNLALNLALVWPFREAGIAAATAVSGLGSFVILQVLLARRIPRPWIAGSALLAALVALAMGAAAWALHRYVLIPHWRGSTIVAEAGRLLAAIAFAAGFYFGLMRLFRRIS